IVVATDMPLLVPALLRAVAAACRDVDVVMPVRDGRPEPLLGAYRRAVAAAATALLDAGERRPRVLLERLPSRRLDAEALRAHDAELTSFGNVNTAADLARVAGVLRDRRGRRGATIGPTGGSR
ncbi:MAG: NTP transferase domain-containing protein, partial [Chloroflexota bacterium]|nr:NTP transferase domain-containing protein [Chloroflexota bacterium]